MEEKTEKGQQIGQLPKRDVLTGNEQFPFQEDRENGSITPNVLKSFISSGKGGYMSYITEYNVSIHHPSSGIDSGNKYTLEGAIVQVPEDIRMVGLKVSFLNNSGLVETWEFAGGVFENIENWKSNEDKLTDIRDEAIDKIKDAESDAISNFSSQRVTPDMLSESTKQFINASGGGTINNLADDEDLVSVDKGENLSVLKFADRPFSPDRFSGKGYKILRRNIVGRKNILTQEMINQPDTIYEIRYDFDLDGAEISIPEGCILKFNGGRFLNALNIKGDVENKYLMPEWFGASNDGKTDSSDAFNAIVRICRSIRCSNKKTYLFTKDIDAKILNELSIDMNMSSFIDFHIVINMNDGINDWRTAYSSIGLSIKEGFIMSKGSDTKYRNWQIPVIISGAPVRLDNISIRRAPYILALADRYIDVMRWHNVIYYSWEDTYSDVIYRLDAINVVLRDGTISKMNEGQGLAGDAWIFNSVNEFRGYNEKRTFDYKLGTFRGGLYTNFINCIQSNIALTQKIKANFTGCHWEASGVTIEGGGGLIQANFIGCYFYMNSRILSENQGVTYIGCYFRGLWDKAGDMTMPEFLNNTDIVDMNCVFLNCRIGGTLVDTNWYKACYYNYNRTTSLGMRQYVIDAFNKKNIELKDIGNIINNRENGNYKYTIYLLCGENIPIAKRAFNIDITDSDKEKTPYFYINPGKNYGFEVYRESPNGKKEVVVGFSSVNDVETLSFQDFSDCALIGEHDSTWSSMKTSVLLWKPVKDDIPDKALYPHLFYNQGVLVSTSGNLKSPITDFLAIPYLNVGVTSQRPGNADNGFQFFDVTLRKPIWWNGSSWVDASGVSV